MFAESESGRVAAMQQRLDELERRDRRRSRRARAVGAVCLGLLAAAKPWTAFVADEVKAKAFVLVDDEHRTRASLAFDERGEPELALFGRAADPRIKLRVREGEAFVNVFDARGKTRLGFAVDKHGSPHVLLLDADERSRAQLTTSVDGAPGIMFVHADGSIEAGLGVAADGGSWRIGDDRPPGGHRAAGSAGAHK